MQKISNFHYYVSCDFTRQARDYMPRGEGDSGASLWYASYEVVPSDVESSPSNYPDAQVP